MRAGVPAHLQSGVPDISGLSAILIDVDGTLIDSNAAHAESWAIALTEHGYPSDAARIRPLVGMGADKLLPKVANLEESSSEGRAIAARKKALFDERLPRLHPTPGARDLIAFLRKLDKTIVVATSAGEKEMHALLAQAGVDHLIPERTSKDDASESKPDPDIVRAALARAGSQVTDTVMVGDTPYDIEAARRTGIATIAFRCGGHWTDDDLRGAAAIVDDPAALLASWRQ